ncbi:MAG TPA: phosphodiesterase, partial [Thermoplasmata archaeon]|nr:phosphodiesterase [Thermoplasmata archaeon]
YTYPKALKKEIKEVVGEYIIDVKNFRTEDKDWLLEQIYEMTEKRFALVNHLLDSREWDFFMFVEMGVDRIHHGFWKWEDPSHPKYESGHKYNNAIRRYYIYLDKEIGKILKRLEELQEKEDSEITVLVVSDHGAKAMKGGICFNEWLIKEGLLTLKEKPKGMVKVENWMIDWGRTKVWGAGGYYGRLFINVKGREPKGVVPKEEYEKFRDELIEKLVGLVDEEGRNIGTKVLKPEESYREVKNIPPDLIVYFGNLDWRSVGSVGTGSIYTYENDTGPDDANHDMYGIFIMSGPNTKKEWREDLKIYDVAPTILELLGVDVPKDMIGKAVK